MKRLTSALVVSSIVLSATMLLIAQQRQPRVIGIATATVQPGHMTAYQNTIRDRIMPFFKEQGVEVIGILENQIGGPSNELTIIVAYRDMAHVQKVAESSALTTIQRDTFESIRILNNRMLRPVAFSPLQ